ncbi:MAG: methyltransferase domain-containing protein, partial [Pirellulaceae bacterium]|nr:methyltransferase domain-containing protein [Pirellulaceae bacterium]
MQIPLSVETAVLGRYSAASKTVEPALCCKVSYDRKYLEVLPAELIERDYGCGDPSRFVRLEEIVLDLGSGGGKICYIASQIVGPKGRVIGIDMNDDMLALARKYQREIAGRIGWDNVTFHRGRIQDLALSLDQLDELMLAAGPVVSSQDYLALHRQIEQTRR